MTREELQQAIIHKRIEEEDLEPAFFVGRFGGAMSRMGEIHQEMAQMSDEELVDYAVEHGYATISYDDSNNNQKGR